jgi:hypothetical protein
MFKTVKCMRVLMFRTCKDKMDCQKFHLSADGPLIYPASILDAEFSIWCQIWI